MEASDGYVKENGSCQGDPWDGRGQSVVLWVVVSLCQFCPLPSHGSSRHEPFSFTYPPVASVWVVTLHYLLCTLTHPYPVTLPPIGSGYFQAKPFPVSILQLCSNLVILHLPAYEDGTECSETSAYKIQTPGIYPEEIIQHSEQGENLKSSICCSCYMFLEYFLIY